MKQYFSRFWLLYLAVASLFLLLLSIGNHAATVLAPAMVDLRTHTIIIDAGHGGEDGGATACTGQLESNINLEIALRLDMIFHFLGYETKMVRTTDISVYTEGNTLAAKKASDLRQRVKLVNGTANGVLISIHQNTFSDSRYSGAQVFFAPTEGSRELAEKMQRQLAQLSTGNNRRAKSAENVYLMQHIQSPGILVECGFISNYEEAVRLNLPQYQKMLCASIAASVSDYLNT